MLQVKMLITLRTDVRRGKQEYLSNILLQLLQWSPINDAVPASCYCSECLEASLGRLSRTTKEDMTVTCVERFSQLYAAQQLGGVTKDVTRNPMARSYPD